MSTVVSIDGEVFAPEDAKVSVFDRGFLYGDSVFETIRTYGARPFRLAEHLARLADSAERVFIELPVGLEQLAEEVQRTIALAGNPESYVRLMVTRGSGPLGLDSGFRAHPTRVIITGPLAPPPPEAYTDGIGVITFQTQRVIESTDAAGAKVGNYLVVVLALRKAREQGAAEALIVDGSGSVAEGGSSNVFAHLDGSWVTPPLDIGILAGITRATILAACSAHAVPVREERLSVSDLHRAAEVFICSSIREVIPVVRVDGQAVGDGRPGPRTRLISELFSQAVAESLGG